MNTFDAVRDFLVKKRGSNWKLLSDKTTLEKDLGITGDDADEFMEAFFIEFNINYDKFEIGKYFHSEGIDIFRIGAFIRKLIGSKKLESPNHDITLGDLRKALEKGEWTNPKE